MTKVCKKCGDRIFYSAPDTVYVSTDRKGFWPQWSAVICYADKKFHTPKEEPDNGQVSEAPPLPKVRK